MSGLATARALRIIRLLRLLKLLRLVRSSRIFQRLETQISMPYAQRSLIFMCITIVVVSHWMVRLGLTRRKKK